MTLAIWPAVVCSLLGLLIGTFLQDPIRRSASRQRLTVVDPHCQNCGVRMHPAQRVAWIARFTSIACRHCGRGLWSRMPVIEMFTAAVFAVVGARVGWTWELPAFLVFAATMVVVVIVDRRTYIIPNRIIYPGLFVTFGLLAAASVIEGDFGRLGQAMIGGFGAWLFFAFVWVVNPRGIGFGDVRLSALTGLVAGWVGLGNVILAVFVGLLLGALGGIVMVAAQRAGMKDPIPFGPFLVAGAFIATFFGTSIEFVLG